MINNFIVYKSVPQRFIGFAAAIFIPLFFFLGLVSNERTQQDQSTSTKFVQVRFVTVTSSMQRAHPLLLDEKKVRMRPHAPDSFYKKNEHTNAEVNTTALPLTNSVRDAEVKVSAATVDQVAEDGAYAMAQKFKGKSAIEAYQDARSDIQKMADRSAIALQAERQTKYELFQTAASNAAIPDCLAQGTTTKLGLDSFRGLLAIPALATAAAMGKCK